jgi:hypothetical protein
MDTFIQDILRREIELNQVGFEKVKGEIFQEFEFILPFDYKHGHKFLSSFSVAFLDLYQEKASLLLDSYMSALQENLTECYQHAEEQHLRSLTVEDDLSIHSIDFPKSKNQSEWELNYEMDLDDTIFHVYFEGWKFKTIGMSRRRLV